jgi:hypothetical protein
MKFPNRPSRYAMVGVYVATAALRRRGRSDLAPAPASFRVKAMKMRCPSNSRRSAITGHQGHGRWLEQRHPRLAPCPRTPRHRDGRAARWTRPNK